MFCAVPQAWTSFKTKSSKDMSWLFLTMWFIGDVCLMIYGINVSLPIAIVLNNLLNAVCIIVIAWYK